MSDWAGKKGGKSRQQRRKGSAKERERGGKEKGGSEGGIRLEAENGREQGKGES